MYIKLNLKFKCLTIFLATMLMSINLYSQNAKPELINQYNDLIKENKFKESIEVLNIILTKYPNDLEALMERADIYFHLEKYKDAIKDYTRLVNDNKHDKISPFNCGKSYWKLKLYDSASKYFTISIKSNPNSMSGYFHRGLTNYMIFKTKECFDDFNFIIINQNNLNDDGDKATLWLSYYYRGLMYKTFNEFYKAVDDYDKAYVLSEGNMNGLIDYKALIKFK